MQTLESDAPPKITLTPKEQQFLRHHPQITLAAGISFEPYIMYAKNREIIGFDVDIANLIKKKTGLNINFELGVWQNIQKRSQKRELDGLSTSIPTTARKAYYNTSKSYFSYTNLVIVKKGNPKIIHSLADVYGKRVALQKGNATQNAYIELIEKVEKVEVVYFESIHELIKAIISDKADFLIIDETIFYVANQLLLGNMIESAFTIGELETLHFLLRNDWPELTTIINKGINAITRREMSTIKNRWFGDQSRRQPGANSRIQLTSAEHDLITKKTTKVCIAADQMPYYGTTPSGKHQGILVDYLSLFAQRIGADFTIMSTGTSGKMTESAMDGNCDIVITPKESVKNSDQLNLTSPFISFPYVIATTTDKLFIDDLAPNLDKTFAAAKSSPVIATLQQKYPAIILLEVETIREGLAKVRNEKIFGYIDTSIAIGYTIRESLLLDVKIAGKLGLQTNYIIATRSDQPLLDNIFQKTITSLTDKEKQNIYNQWLAVTYEQGIDYSLTWKILIIAIILIIVVVFWNYRLDKEKTRAEKALQAERAAMKQNLNFVDMISHEYRTPLSVITSSLDVMERKRSSGQKEDLSKQIIRIRKSASRLLNIFETSLDEKRINDAHIRVTKKEFQLTQLIERITDDCRNAYPTYHIKINNQSKGEKLLITADADLLNIALTNILDNACKYSSSSKEIIINYEKQGTNAVISIADKGVGIRPEELNKVFEKYYRSTTVGDKIGAGVGLFLVKQIIDLHSGTISIISKPAERTMLTIKIPLNEHDALRAVTAFF